MFNFDNFKSFEPSSFKSLQRVRGLYFISLTTKVVQYPFGDSRLIYIGMSEKSSNSIYSRLRDHFDGTSGNVGIKNYLKVDNLIFSHLNFGSIKDFWQQNIEDLESYFLLDFVRKFGVYPICNNKTGNPGFDPLKTSNIQINWSFFGRQL